MNADRLYLSYDVVIVGAGPIGLSTAKALQGLGLAIALVERQDLPSVRDPKYDAREIAITHRTRALMQNLGQWQRLDPSDAHLLKRAEVYNGSSPFAMGFDCPKHGKKPLENLGYLIANHRIRKAAFEALSGALRFDAQGDKQADAVDAFFATSVQGVYTCDAFAAVDLDNGAQLRAKLVIAADSRTSFMRRALGISADMHDFGRTVLVFGVSHTKSNRFTAHEGFYYGKTLAVLPLGEFASSMVITVDNAKAQALKALSAEELAAETQSWLGDRLGDIRLTGEAHDYPLLGVHARRFYAKRAALVGDAAVGMHPVTAHGYNLGMESVQILSDLVAKAVHSGQDIGDTRLLRRYSHTHALKTRPMYHGTNAIVKLYTAETPPARALRHAALRFGNAFLPVKAVIARQLTDEL